MNSAHFQIAGFGLGALNDADEDDLDIYDTELKSSSSRNRHAYDEQHGDDVLSLGVRANNKDKVIPSRVAKYPH